MSIKMKILIPMVVLTLVAMTVLLVSNAVRFSDYVNATLTRRLDTASKTVSDELEMKKSAAEAVARSIADDPTIIEAMSKGDRETLISVSKALMAGSGMDFTTITDASGIAFARPHAPDKYGDDVTAMPTVRSALKGEVLAAIEPGATVRMSVCCGVPIVDENGTLLGVVVSGFRLDTETFVDAIKSMLDCEVTVFSGDERISTTVTQADGTRAVGTKSAENVSQIVLAGDTYSGNAKILDRDAITRYTPIFGPDGDVLGMLFVGCYTAEEAKTIESFIVTGLIITLALVIAAVLLILFVTGRIVAPIKTMVKAAHALASGSAEVDMQVDTKDEMRELADAFVAIVENNSRQIQVIEAIAGGDLTGSVQERSKADVMNRALKTMLELNNEVFAQIVGSAEQVSAGTRQIADNSQTLAQGSVEQSSAVEQLSNAITVVSQKTRDNAGMAGQAASLAETIKGNAEKGSRQMDEMMTAVKEINQASQRIGDVIKVIDDIAFQTNILALNAAVEAARAGQHGKGFAVVAEEVRNLAAKSAEAAKNTGSLIVNSMEKAELGTRIANETAASLTEIVSGINESAVLVGRIAQSSEEQSSGIADINQGIAQVAQIIQQNSAAAEESAAASEEMSGEAELLGSLVARFKLREDVRQKPQRLNGQTTQKRLNMPAKTSRASSGESGGFGKY